MPGVLTRSRPIRSTYLTHRRRQLVGPDGFSPHGSLIADANGDLFGTTEFGGAFGGGTVFEITNSGFVVASPPPPTGVSLSPATTSLAGAQSLNGLAANAKVATVAQVGGHAGDSFSYTLGGTGASAFSLISTNNVATLSTGASGAAGGKNGKLYSLTLTANDTTTGTSFPASPFDVVGSSGKDVISLATLVGSSATATPTFIYVNTTDSSERLAATDMKIELQGSVSLTSSNILHI